MALTVLPLNGDSTAFQLFFTIQDKEISLCVHDVPLPGSSSSLANAKIECTSDVRSLFRGFEEVLCDRLLKSTSINSLCVEIKKLLDCIFRAQSKSDVPCSQFFTELLAQIDGIGREHIAFIAEDFTKLSLRVVDDANREHILRMELPPEYPNEEPTISIEIPVSWSLEWSTHAGLNEVLSQFKQTVQGFQEFWDVMDDIDKRASVIEPKHPSRADTFRRIALGSHCSLSMTVNSRSPRSLPQCRFFGPNTAVAPLRQKLNDNIMKWTLDKFLLDNLEILLEMSIPSPQSHFSQQQHEDFNTECGICYAYRLPDDNAQGNEPDRVCDNANCGRPFHTACLVDWLHSLSTTRRSFNVLFGSCPYCSDPLAVKSANC